MLFAHGHGTENEFCARNSSRYIYRDAKANGNVYHTDVRHNTKWDTRAVAYGIGRLAIVAMDNSVNALNHAWLNSQRSLSAWDFSAMTVADYNVLPDGSITQLNPLLVKHLGAPVDIDCAPHLTRSLYRAARAANYRQSAGYHLMRAGRPIDARGTFAFLGNKFNDQIAAHPRRICTMTSLGLNHPNRHRDAMAGFAFKSYRPTQVVDQHRIFLYRQPLKYWDPWTNREVLGTWVGLATTMPITIFDQPIAGQGAYPSFKIRNFRQWVYNVVHLADIACSTEVDQHLPQLLEGESVGQVVDHTGHPLARYGVRSYPREIPRHVWRDLNLRNERDYVVPPSPALLESMNVEMALGSTPAGIQINRLEAQLKEKTRGVNNLTPQVVHLKKELAAFDIETQKDIAAVRNLIAKIKARKHARSVVINTSMEKIPRLAREQVRKEKISQVLAVKQKDFLERKQIYISQLKDGTIPDYNENLAKSGILIQELHYRQISTGAETRASIKPEVTTDPDWRLIKAEMRTTRPIAMSMGIPEGEEPRVSGPHKLTAHLHNGGNVSLELGALFPWSVIGVNPGESSFKAYPHTPSTSLNTGNTGRFQSSLTTMHTVCLGMLADTASRAFRENSPRMLALAILSYLSSVDPQDSWGKTYKWFPKQSDVSFTPIQPGKYQPVQNPGSKGPESYVPTHRWFQVFMSTPTKYAICFATISNQYQWIYGDCQVEGQVIKPTSAYVARNVDPEGPHRFTAAGREWTQQRTRRFEFPNTELPETRWQLYRRGTRIPTPAAPTP